MPQLSFTDRTVKQAKCLPASRTRAKGHNGHYLESAKAGELARTEFFDPGFQGLRLEVEPSGRRKFIFRYSFAGKLGKLTFGEYPGCTLAIAHDLWRDARAALARGENPADTFKAKRASVDPDDTITAFVHRFKKQRFVADAESEADREEGEAKAKRGKVAKSRKRKVGLSSQDYYERELDRFADKYGARHIAKVPMTDLDTFIEKQIDRGDAAQRTTWRVLRTFWNWAAPKAGIENPMADIAAPSQDGERDRFLTDDEIKVVWKAATDALNPPSALTRLLLLTGCRRNEIACLRRDQLKPDKIVFPGSLTKNGKPHEVPRTWLIDKVLAELPAKGEFVLTGTDEGHTGHTKSRDAIKTPDLDHWTFHDLRRTFASGLARLGIPREITERAINHKSGTSRDRLAALYQRHDYAAETAAAFETWTDHVAALVGEKASDKKAAA